MIEPDHSRLSIVRPCQLVSIARSSHYYAGKGESPLYFSRTRHNHLRIMKDHLRHPRFYSARSKLTCHSITGGILRSSSYYGLQSLTRQLHPCLQTECRPIMVLRLGCLTFSQRNFA